MATATKSLSRSILRWPLLFSGFLALPFYRGNGEDFNEYGCGEWGDPLGDGYGDSDHGSGVGNGQGKGYSFARSGNGWGFHPKNGAGREGNGGEF